MSRRLLAAPPAGSTLPTEASPPRRSSPAVDLEPWGEHHVIDPSTGRPLVDRCGRPRSGPAPRSRRTPGRPPPWSGAVRSGAPHEAGVDARLVDRTGRVTALGSWPQMRQSRHDALVPRARSGLRRPPRGNGLGDARSTLVSRPAHDTRGRDRRVLRQLAHRSAAVVTLAMLSVHATLLVVDSYLDLSLPGALVPFTAGYRGFALGLGTLAAYALLVVALTGAARGRLAPSFVASRTWRAVHALGLRRLGLGDGPRRARGHRHRSLVVLGPVRRQRADRSRRRRGPIGRC